MFRAPLPVIFGDRLGRQRKEIIGTTQWNEIIYRELIICTIFGVLLVSLFSPHAYSASNSYALSVNSAFGTTSGSGSYVAGETATFSVFPPIVYVTSGSTRYVFTGWSCSGTGCYVGSNSSASITMNDNITETANWKTQYLLSASSSLGGSVKPSGEKWYDVGSVVAISESPNNTWFFAYWSLDRANAGSSQTESITMNSAHTIVANFIKPELDSRMVNVTGPSGTSLRNPDGTFYRLDKFEIKWSVVLVGGNALPLTISFGVNYTYPQNVLIESGVGEGYALFTVLPSSPFAPFNVTLAASIFNSVDSSIRSLPINSSQPFAIVDYSPHFKDMSYIDYNSLNSSDYEHAFVILVRYDGNSPGYTYSGNLNTDPFSALNSTGERAIVNEFAFSTEGWSISSNLSDVNNSMNVIKFVLHPSLGILISNQNKTTQQVITWSNRIQKYYFLPDIHEFKNYIDNYSMIYFNLTVSVKYASIFHSVNYATSDYNTSCLYEPLFFNGYLVFRSFGGTGANLSVSITSHNPSPLDSYLVSKATYVFGGDARVISSMEKDLYPANSTTVLRPVISNAWEKVFLVNETNIALPGMDQMPYFVISVSGNSGYTDYTFEPNNPPYYLSNPTTYYGKGELANITYEFYDYLGLFLMNDLPHSFQLANLTGYYLIQASPEQDLIMEPLNFSFTSSSPYLVRTYDNSSQPFFVSYEPGNLSQSYPMIYGENTTNIISPNFVGGGIIGLDGNPISLEGGVSFGVSLLIGNSSGGATRVWVISDKGQVLYNESLMASLLGSQLGPSGYVGQYTFQFPVGDTSHSVSIYVENAWGGLSIIDSVEINPHSPPSPSYSPAFVSMLLLLAFTISYAYTIFARRSSARNS